MSVPHVLRAVAICGALLPSVAGDDAALAAGAKNTTTQTTRTGARVTAIKDYKYRFTVPYELSQLPNEVTQVGIKCEVCEHLATGSARCGSTSVSGSQSIPVRQGAASGQAQIEIREYLTKQTSQTDRNTPITEGLHYACYLEFNGNSIADANGKPSYMWKPAEGTTAVVVSSGPIPN